MFNTAFVFFLIIQPAFSPNIFFVSPLASIGQGNGTLFHPWATLSEANAKVPDTGARVLVMDGIYDGRIQMNRRFVHRTVFKAMNPYRAVLTHSSKTAQILTSVGGANFTIEGFEIQRFETSAKGPLLVQIQKGTLPARNIIIRNNIFHDSYNNDLLKVNNECANVTIEGNIFYNQSGPDEHIDVNGVTGVTIQDNIFFNDFPGSNRGKKAATGSYIVVKNSADVPKNQDITVRRNIFLNWQGSDNNSFILIGEDGKPDYEARNVLVENNLMIGNSSTPMRAAFGVRGARDILFRNNTVAGNLPSIAFAFSLVRYGRNPENKNVRFHNNIWSDPTGTMGNFSESKSSNTEDSKIDRNLYYNAGVLIPGNSGVLQVSKDRHAIIGDPVLGDQSDLLLPRWIPEQGTFVSGTTTIREEFVRLVKLYGMPGPGSLAVDAGDPASSASEDILGNRRGPSPDLGACEVHETKASFSHDQGRIH